MEGMIFLHFITRTMRLENDDDNRTHNSCMSSETASSSRCSSSFSSLSEHSNISGESLQEAKKRALKGLETRFLRVKQYAKVTHERRKALQRNVKNTRETVLRHNVLICERQNQCGRAEKIEQSEKESAVLLSKTAETCFRVLRKTKDRMWFCEQRANRYAIAREYLEKVLAAKRSEDLGENDHASHEEGKQETVAGTRGESPSSSYSLASNHHHHDNAVKFEDISDIIARSNSLRAINDTLTSRLSQAQGNARVKASEHEFALATFRARRLEVEQNSLRHLQTELENARILSSLEREKSAKKRDERLLVLKLKSTIANLYENILAKSCVNRSIDTANERLDGKKTNTLVVSQLHHISHFANDVKCILLR